MSAEASIPAGSEFAGADSAFPSAGLPRDLLLQATRRVGAASLVFAAIWLYVLLMNNAVLSVLGDPAGRAVPWSPPQNALAIAGLLLSAAFAAIVTGLRHRPALVVDLGLLFEVLTAGVVAFVTQWTPRMELTSVSWVCVVVLVYPAIAPASPGKTLLASLAAVTMDPIAIGVTVLRGVPFDPSAFELLWLLLPNYVSAAAAVVPAVVIRGLGREIRQARELGSYRLQERLGGGGMGEVYRATHRLLARPAAIKLISPSVLRGASSNLARVLRERFRREAEAAASLTSPHTIQLYDFGIAPDGTFYYVMELLEGLDFEQLVAQFGPLPSERALHLLRQAADSLAEAHARGMVHRDVKPSNLFACRMGLTVDFVKVLDFGLVKSVTPGLTGLTESGLPAGTPAYMAPEVGSEPAAVGPAADVYAMGCVGYWLLTGRTVFEATNAFHMVFLHETAPPEPPSRHAAHPVPRALDDLVLACLQKRPRDRPADGAALLDRLHACPGTDLWGTERSRQWWREHLDPVPSR